MVARMSRISFLPSCNTIHVQVRVNQGWIVPASFKKKKEERVPRPSSLAHRVGRSASVTGFVLADGTHQRGETHTYEPCPWGLAGPVGDIRGKPLFYRQAVFRRREKEG